MEPREILCQSNLGMMNACPQSYSFCLFCILHWYFTLPVWIRIRNTDPDRRKLLNTGTFGSNFDPDPQH